MVEPANVSAVLDGQRHASQQRCVGCGYPMRAPSDSESVCACCLAGCPPFNEFFRCELEARLAWMGLSLTLHSAVRPFPGDHAATPAHVSAKGRDLFDALHQVDLAAYAARFTELKPAGPGKWKGICALHQERTPSFYVYGDPWRWRCYGACAQGGDIVALSRELRGAGRR
jgi:hypothetical protein